MHGYFDGLDNPLAFHRERGVSEGPTDTLAPISESRDRRTLGGASRELEGRR